MKKIHFALCLLVAAALVSCSKEQSQPTSHDSAPDFGQLGLGDVARILSELPLQEEQLREVHDAVSSSSGNGYDEEYMMSDLFNSPGAGVGSEGVSTKSGEYATPMRQLFREYLEEHAGTKAGEPDGIEACIEHLAESDMQIYWPYSDRWDGKFPVIVTFDPGYGAECNTGYEINVDGNGERSIAEVIVDEAVAATHTVWVVNRNDDSAFTPLDLFKDKTEPAGTSEDREKKKLMLRRFKMLRNYDSWFGGASEFFVKCGSASGFKATSLEDLQLYTPSVTDFMIVVKRSQLKKDVDINTIIVTDFSDAIDKMAFLIIEDDGGTTTSWKCSATVKYKSKSYGFEMEIPYRDKDDIVWRGQLSGEYFTEGEEVTGRFGDVVVTFALE